MRVSETARELVAEFELATCEHTQALRTEREPRMREATSALYIAREDLLTYVAELESDAERWCYVRDNGYVVTRAVTIADGTQCAAGRVGDGFATACVDAMIAQEADAALGGG